MSRQLLTHCRLFDGETVSEGRAVLIEAGRIARIGMADDMPDYPDVVDLGGRLLAPGLIDLQVNGGGGVLFNDSPTLAALQTIVSAHRRYGTTACLPTLISDDSTTMRAGISAVAEALAGRLPAVVGIHLEGPHLNPRYRGVHDAQRLRPLNDEDLDLLCSLASGRTLVTLAPETVAAEQIRRLCDAGVIVFGGHSAASYEETKAALAAGLSGFTHLYNAMTPLTSRAPGMVGAALDDDNSYIGIIADGHHVHPASLRIAIRAKAPGQVCLVTDAMPTVGSPDDHFVLHGAAISAIDGRCVTADGTLAGSDIGMIDAVRNVTRFGGVDRYEALRMASAYPAAALGIDDTLGYVREGYRADLIELDDDLTVRRSWVQGEMEAFA
ncbi:MAG: N-acetylglucosamine-6-phosphate deacetylase [Gammaproteobacteria bacterium]|nr:N-acetylglucosamine-6-phosphate deacetylase [Gammaproteobacteria bacterium]